MTTHSPSGPRHPRWLVWLPLFVCVILMLLVALVRVSLCPPVAATVPERWGWLPTAFSALGFGVLCGLIISRQPRNRIGWLCGAISLAVVLVNVPPTAVECVNQAAGPIPGLSYLIWLGPISGLAILLEFFLLPLWFPDGRFLSAGWRRFAIVVCGLLLLSTLLVAFWPGRMMASGSSGQTVLDNPFGLPFTPSSDLTRLVQVFYSITFVGSILIAQFSLFARWRRSDGAARQQLKVLAFYLLTIGVVYMPFQLLALLLSPSQEMGRIFDWLYLVLLILLWVGYPTATGVAVLKYRMYDVDVVIRKTLVYAALTGLLALVYFGSVVLLQGLFSRLAGVQQSTLAVVISTLAIYVLFRPVRRRIQDVIDRRFFRKKYDAQQVLASFAQTARDETDLDALLAELVQVVDETLQPEHVRIWLRKE
jgi:hypothetical protein